MEFLTNYGLFIAKTITLLIALMIAVGILVSASQKGQKDEEHIEIEKLNDKFDNYKETLQQSLLSSDELKAQKKLEKKKAKEQKKADKNKKGEDDADQKKRVFVVEFDGDVKASDTENLRTLISAILIEAKEQDEVVVKLESAGGMVHTYGLAASQLARITNKKIPLTVCVDHVAASGGYMMACVADKIIAAPFAIIGSIGVIAQLPNFHKLLKKNDVDYEMFTAGEYKRTLTMFGENTDKGREKFVEDLEDTHVLFKEFVSEHRSQVNIDEVATGEIWFGRRAVDQNLVDQLSTSDEYLYELSKESDVFELKIEHKQNFVEKLGISISKGVEKTVLESFNLMKTRYFS